MSALPHPITDALHIEEPFPVWTLLAGALALWLLYRLARRWSNRPVAPVAPVAPPPEPAGASRVVALIEAIRRETLEQRSYRAGCHRLAAALKEHFGASLWSQRSFEHLTAAEIAVRIGDGPVSRFFSMLSELQFYRPPPSRSDFDGACDLALDVVVGAASSARPRRGGGA